MEARPSGSRRTSANGCRASQRQQLRQRPVIFQSQRGLLRTRVPPGRGQRRASASQGPLSVRLNEPPFAQLRHALEVDEPAVPQDGHAVAHLLHLAQHVRREQHRLPAVAGAAHLLQQFVAHGRIEGVGRLVHDNQQGAAARSTCSSATLRFMPDDSVAMGRSRSMSKRRARSSMSPLHRLTAQPAEELDELTAGHVLVQAQLARQVGDVAAGGDAVAPAVVAGDAGRPGGGPQEAQEQAQGRGLAGAVGAEQAEHLARRHVQVEVVEGAEAAVVFRQVFGSQQHGWSVGGRRRAIGAAVCLLSITDSFRNRRDGCRATESRFASPIPSCRRGQIAPEGRRSIARGETPGRDRPVVQ